MPLWRSSQCKTYKKDCSLLAISEHEVKKKRKELSTEKSTGVDMTPPKLVKLAENYLAWPPSQSINDSIKKE